MFNSKKMKNMMVLDYDYLKDNTIVHQSMVESNMVVTTLYDTDVKLIKLCNQSCAFLNDCVEYTIIINNNNSYAVENFYIIDFLSCELKYIKHSLMLNNRPISGDITQGIYIGKLEGNEIKKITFKVQVICLPPCLTIHNQAIGYFNDDMLHNQIRSNVVYLSIDHPELRICLKVSKKCVKINSHIKYQIQLTNVGTLTAHKVKVRIETDPGLAIDWNSLTVNNKHCGFEIINNEIKLFKIESEKTYFIEYEAVVKKDCSSLNTIVQAKGSFNNPCNPCEGIRNINSNIEEVKIYVLKEYWIETPFSISLPIEKSVNSIKNLQVNAKIQKNELISSKNNKIQTQFYLKCVYDEKEKQKSYCQLSEITTTLFKLDIYHLLTLQTDIISIDGYYDWCHHEFLISGKLKLYLIYC